MLPSTRRRRTREQQYMAELVDQVLEYARKRRNKRLYRDRIRKLYAQGKPSE